MKLKKIFNSLIGLIITLIIVSLLTFIGFDLVQSDPATIMLDTDATPEMLAHLREELGLNKPLIVRYFLYILGIFHGDLGYSYIYKQSVIDLIGDKIYITSFISISAFILIIIISFILSILIIQHQNSIFDYLMTILNQINMSIPSFFLGIIITYMFGFVIKLFKPGGYVPPEDGLGSFLSYMIFPIITIAIPKTAMTIKLFTNSLRDELVNDYVRTAISRGNSRRRVLYRHVMKNAVLPVITFLGMLPASMIASSVVVEQVFGVPGLGRLLVNSIYKRDYPVVQAIILFIAVVVVCLNYLVDIMYILIDKRIKSDVAR